MKSMDKYFDWLLYLLEVVLFIIYTPLLILTLIVSLIGFTIGIPVLFLKFIRDFFPDNGEMTNFGIVFSWYDLIIYVPGGLIAFLLLKNAIIPITWYVCKDFIKFPRR